MVILGFLILRVTLIVCTLQEVDGGSVCPISRQVSWRIQNATLMNVFTSNGGEAYQVANYGIGGQYAKHYDASGTTGYFL